MAELGWLSDYVLGVLKSPTWMVPISEFVDRHADLFDEAEECSLEQMRCHMAYRDLVSQLLQSHLEEVAISEEGFEAFCLQGLCSAALHRTLAEQLLGAEDFLSFKAMMAKHNATLCREVVSVDADVEPDSPHAGLVSEVVKNSMASGLDEWQVWDRLCPGAAEEELRQKREEAELQQA
ncbi:unnamed protein product, partial [Effrenium voratum]